MQLQKIRRRWYKLSLSVLHVVMTRVGGRPLRVPKHKHDSCPHGLDAKWKKKVKVPTTWWAVGPRKSLSKLMRYENRADRTNLTSRTSSTKGETINPRKDAGRLGMQGGWKPVRPFPSSFMSGQERHRWLHLAHLRTRGWSRKVVRRKEETRGGFLGVGFWDQTWARAHFSGSY